MIYDGNNLNVQVTGNNQGVSVNGNSDNVSVTGGNTNSVEVFGNSDNTFVSGSNDIVRTNGNGDTVRIFGDNNNIDVDRAQSGSSLGPINSLFVSGNNNTVQSFANAVEISGNSSGTFDGSFNSVTVDGNSTVTFVGSPSSLAFDQVTVGDNDVINITAGANNIFSLGNNDIVNISGGTNNTVTANGKGDSTVLSGSGTSAILNESMAVSVADNSSVTVSGNVSQITVGNNDTLSVGSSSGIQVVASGSGDTLEGSRTANSANMNNGTLALADGTSVTFTSGGLAGGGWSITGTGDAVAVNSAAITINDGVSAALNGNSDQITVGNSDTVAVSGNNETVNVSGTGSTITVSGSGDTITGGPGNTVILSGNLTAATISGGIAVDVADGSTVGSIFGDQNVITAGNNTTFMLEGQNDQVVVNSSITTHVETCHEGATAQILVSGSHSSVLIDQGTDQGTNGGTVIISGNSDTVTDLLPAQIAMSGTNDKVTAASNSTIQVAAGASGGISGNNDTIAFGGAATVSISGASDSVNFGNGVAGKLTSGTISPVFSQPGFGLNIAGPTCSATFSGSLVASVADDCNATLGLNGSTINLGCDDTATITGSNDTINLNGCDTVTVIGSNDTINVNGTHDTINIGSSGSNTAVISTNTEIVNFSGVGGTVALAGTGAWATITQAMSLDLENPADAPDDWNERAFFSVNADVMQAVINGTFTSGWDFYKVYGPSEGRTGGFVNPPGAPVGWNEAAYLANHSTGPNNALAGVINGTYADGLAADVASAAQSHAPVDWNEAAFLASNQDVLSDVISGVFTNGWAFYQAYGQQEGRTATFENPPGAPQDWSEEAFLDSNPDVRSDVISGVFTSGWAFYQAYGPSEGRTGGFVNPVGAPVGWNEAAYLANHSTGPNNALAGVIDGTYTSGWAADLAIVATEKAPVDWNEAAFLAKNQDVLSDVISGVFTSGWAFEQVYGTQEGRTGGFMNPPDAPSDWNEEAFLDSNTDVRADVVSGVFTSGWDFFKAYGPQEGRAGAFVNPPDAPSFWNEAGFMNNNQDVVPGLISGAFKSGWDFFVDYGPTEGRTGEFPGATMITASGSNQFVQAPAGNSVVVAQGNNDTLDGGGGNSVLIGGPGTNNYLLDCCSGNETIINSDQHTGPTGTLTIGAGVTDSEVWLSQSHDDLVVNIMGTSNTATIAGWFRSSNDQVQEIKTSDGMELDTQVSSLVQAMATYSAAHPGFNPTAVSNPLAPNDPAVQLAISQDWHHASA